MATSKLTTWWTSLISALVALFAAFGFAGQASAAAPAASVPQNDVTHNRSEPPASVAPTVHWALPAPSALPPTMKQRIRAEAHGASPSSRHRADVHDGPEGPQEPGGTGATATNTAPAGDDEPEDSTGAEAPTP
ncbi:MULTISPECIES: DUF6344 domain-containing protein [unclassified Streptomyces]|uniref:DUF6344 domain-containing protein n=1 Tax=unclassified Streptomyces TaxID=2593676 RepID=UPI0038155651